MIKDNILKIKERIERVCSKVGQDPAQITIVAVTKGRSLQEIEEAISCGISAIGENKVQEALLKYRQLMPQVKEPAAIRWHMVGHLQTNKVKDALKLFGLIHSADSLHLAQEIDKQASRINKLQDILVEVKTSAEATKSGLRPEEAINTLSQMANLKNINICGLMTIAPLAEDPQQARPYFKMLRQLRDKIYEAGVMKNRLGVLSMGMTDDFEAAIEEGATMVRLGRAIFEG